MSQFKPGDVVRCVNPPNRLVSSPNEPVRNGIYIVTSLGSACAWLKDHTTKAPLDGGWVMSRFELFVEDEPC